MADTLIEQHASAREAPATHPAVVAVMRKAQSMRAGKPYAFATDPHTFARGKKPAALIALITPAGEKVLAVDMHELVGACDFILRWIGCTDPDAMDKAEATVAEQAKPRAIRK